MPKVQARLPHFGNVVVDVSTEFANKLFASRRVGMSTQFAAAVTHDLMISEQEARIMIDSVRDMGPRREAIAARGNRHERRRSRAMGKRRG